MSAASSARLGPQQTCDIAQGADWHGGGAASSLATGVNVADLDSDSVRRGNAEMERRAQEVIAAIAASRPAPGSFVVTLALAALYERHGAPPMARSALVGVAAVRAGMLLTMGPRIASDLRARSPLVAVAGVLWMAIVALRLPLVAITPRSFR